jgi:hypothetical protein
MKYEHSYPIGHWPKMAGALNTGDQGDQGDRGDAPAKKKRQIFMGSHRSPLGRLGRLGPLHGSDGGPRQRTSETFPINQTEFKKSFLRRQFQSIVIFRALRVFA